MRRWNGWGDSTTTYPLTPKARTFLENLLGPGSSPRDAQHAEVLAAIPPSRLKKSSLFTVDSDTRLRHARGQSLPDWVALRSGEISSFPDGIAFPRSEADIAELMRFASQSGAHLIPYGGGTSVVGHINPLTGDAPVLTISMRHMNGLETVDERSMLATFGAGVSGPEIEAQLRARYFTLGHFPQSFEFSTLGGWIATRSKGQQALHFGQIEDMFAGGTLLSPAGKVTMPPHPASAAGPDLRQLVLGSEGRMGLITDATVRITPLPEEEQFHALFFPDFASGKTAVREMVQARLPLSMLRLSTPSETETTLILAGHERLIGLMERYLGIRGVSLDKSLLLAGISGTERLVNATRKEAMSIAKRHGGIHLGTQFGKQWQKSRFHTPYLRNTLWEMGYAVDTLETAVRWSSIDETLQSIENALSNALDSYGERVHIFSHLSHLYSSGASIYVTYLFRPASDPQETLQRWRELKSAASEAIIAAGGTISHQHGVGLDHKQYLHHEKGDLGMDLISDVLQRMDPQGIMNPGKLLDVT